MPFAYPGSAHRLGDSEPSVIPPHHQAIDGPSGFSYLADDVYAYLLGIYLGDGWIGETPRGVQILRVTLDAAHTGIAAEVQQAVQAAMPRTASESSIDERLAASTSRATPSDGRSCCPSTVRVESTTGRSYGYVRYAFTNRSNDIKRIFCDHPDLLRVRWTRPNDRNIGITRQDAVRRLDEFVGPKR